MLAVGVSLFEAMLYDVQCDRPKEGNAKPHREQEKMLRSAVGTANVHNRTMDAWLL